MILDMLGNAERYYKLHHRFMRAFDFLRNVDLEKLPKGRSDIDGDNLYAIVVRDIGAARASARLESHQKYIDIQLALSGCDCIGWKHIQFAERNAYDEQKDVEFHTEPPMLWVETPPEIFVIFFPEDAHAPMCGEGMIHKVVIKVAIEKLRRV